MHAVKFVELYYEVCCFSTVYMCNNLLSFTIVMIVFIYQVHKLDRFLTPSVVTTARAMSAYLLLEQIDRAFYAATCYPGSYFFGQNCVPNIPTK